MVKAGKAGNRATSSVTPGKKGKAGKAGGATPKSGKKMKKTAAAAPAAGSDDEAKAEPAPSQINCPGGYKVVAYRFGPDGTARHTFVKTHSAKKNSDDAGLPKGRTLFVLNPPFGSPASLAALCAEFGSLEDVQMTSIPAISSLSVETPAAYVVFEKTISVGAALGVDCRAVLEIGAPDKSAHGLKRWEREHDEAVPQIGELQAKIDADMRLFDDKTHKEKALRLAMHGKEDEDGWTMVTKGAKKEEPAVKARGSSSLIRTSNGAGAKTKPDKKEKKDKELTNFYRFQIKDARKEQIAVLRQKFDQDKLKIKRMQENRKFRPY